MKVKSSRSGNSFVIYREKWGVLIFQLIMSVFTIAVGALFTFYVAKESGKVARPDSQLSYAPIAFKWLGYVFMVFGSLIIVALPSRLKKLQSKGTGDELLRAEEKGLHLSEGLGGEIFFYPWEKIKKIEISKEVRIQYHKNRWQKTKNYILVFFQPNVIEDSRIERAKRRVQKSQEGDVFFISTPNDKKRGFLSKAPSQYFKIN